MFVLLEDIGEVGKYPLTILDIGNVWRSRCRVSSTYTDRESPEIH